MNKYPIPEELQQAYSEHLAQARVVAARQLFGLAILLYLVFALIDIWAIPSVINTIWVIRAVEVLSLGAVLWCTRYRFFKTYYVPIILVSALLAGAGIEAMVYLAGAEDLARHFYYAGIILVVMGVYSFTFLPVWQAALCGVALFAIFLLIEVFFRPHDVDEFSILAINSAFIISANVLGIFAAMQRNQYIRESFLLRQNLVDDLVRVRQEKEQNEFWSDHDPLTSLPNRKKLMRELEHHIEAATLAKQSIAVLFIDLDGFKAVNDNHGHTLGDEMLTIVADRLTASVRESDLVARLGGDEFVVILTLERDDREAPMRIAQGILASIERPVRHSTMNVALSASIGIAFYPDDAEHSAELIRVADSTMYQAKRLGKGRIAISA